MSLCFRILIVYGITEDSCPPLLGRHCGSHSYKAKDKPKTSKSSSCLIRIISLKMAAHRLYHIVNNIVSGQNKCNKTR